MFSVNNKIEDYILKRLSNYNLAISYDGTDIEIRISDDSLYNILSFLQHDTHCQFEQLLDLVVLDCPDQEKRFDLIYVVRSLKNNQRMRVLTSVNSEIVSIAEIYRDASWLEREAWEMFGIFFKNSRDLRRLLTDFTLGGYPLRKDYPSSGLTDHVFDEQTNRFLSVPLSLLQEHRIFDVSSPWKGSPDMPSKKEFYLQDDQKEAITENLSEEELVNEP